jgi:hypothetical protein
VRPTTSRAGSDGTGRSRSRRRRSRLSFQININIGNTLCSIYNKNWVFVWLCLDSLSLSVALGGGRLFSSKGFDIRLFFLLYSELTLGISKSNSPFIFSQSKAEEKERESKPSPPSSLYVCISLLHLLGKKVTSQSFSSILNITSTYSSLWIVPVF